MPRRILLVLLALLVVGGTVILAQLLLHGGSGRRPGAGAGVSKAAPTQVLVAKSDLHAGQFLTPADMDWQAWPDGALAPGYMVQGKSRLGDVVGAVVTSQMAAGEPITPARVVRPSDRGFMAAVLAPGDRAITLNVTPSTGMGGFLFPGDRVDLILTETVQAGAEGGTARHVSETILRGIRVVGLDQSFSDKRDDKKALAVPRTATLEVTPKQAETVLVANDLGVLSLVLDSVASPGPSEANAPVTRTWDIEATRIAPSAPARPAGPAGPGRGPAPTGPVWTVDVVRGGVTTITPFPIGRSDRPGAPQ